MEYIYILAKKRGQRDPEIVAVCNSYDKAVIAYHECDSWNTFIYKYPTNIVLEEFSHIQKSSKYRMKFEEDELRKEYARCKRDSRIESLMK